MISLFRRLRQRMLTKNKVSQYLLYAIGEILLIVIGILLAVQVNDWNTDRNEQREEQQLLRQLRTEFEANRGQIKDKIFLHNQIVSSGISVLAIIDTRENNQPMDSIYGHLGWTLTAPTFDPSLGVTNDLINSGKLYLIRNDNLRHLISGWSGDIDFATEEEKIWLKIRDEFYVPYIKETLSFRNVLHAIENEDSNSRDIMNFGRSYISTKTGPSRLDTASEKVFTEQELLTMEDHIAELTNLNQISITQMTELEKVADSILELIDKEINPSTSSSKL